MSAVPIWVFTPLNENNMQHFIKNKLFVLYLNRFLKMTGQDITREVKMMKFLAEECGVVATSRPWEMKTVGTQTQVLNLLQKLLREEKAISKLLSHPLQNSPHSSKCFQHSTFGSPAPYFVT